VPSTKPSDLWFRGALRRVVVWCGGGIIETTSIVGIDFTLLKINANQYFILTYNLDVRKSIDTIMFSKEIMQ